MQQQQHIDIPVEKALDWCVARGTAPSDWLVQLKSLQSKVKNSLVNPSFNIPLEIQQQIEQDGCSYYSLQDAFNQLSSSILISLGLTAQDTPQLKNFFGRYTDASLKALDALLQLYHTNNLFLTESIRFLVQATKYDIPVLKKTLVQNEKQQDDLQRKITETHRTSRELSTKLTTQLKSNWQIDYYSSANLEAQIKERIRADIPKMFNEVVGLTKEPKFVEAVEYYREFLRFTMNVTSANPTSPSSSSSSVTAASAASLFPTILAIRTSELLPLPETKETTKSSSTTATTTTTASDGIEWDISIEAAGESASSSTPAADSAKKNDEAAASSGEINWDDDDDITAAPVTSSSEPIELDWQIETTESGNAADAKSSSSSAASSSSSASSLDSEATRHAFLSELLELESFLAERVVDLTSSASGKTGSDEVSAALFQGRDVSQKLTLQSTGAVQTYLTAVRSTLTAFRSPRLTQLLLIRSSARSLARVVAGIRQEAATVDRVQKSATEQEARRAELQHLTQRTSSELRTLIDRTSTMKTRVETEISQRFQNRPVHIVGEISQMLQG